MADGAVSPDKGTVFSGMQSIQCGSAILDLSTPVVMGILNITPDSFFDGGRHNNLNEVLRHTGKMIAEGAAIIDIGAVSTRPGAAEVTEDEEKKRLFPVVEAVHKRFPEIILSIDTYRPAIAGACCAMGAGIINDISAGQFDPGMFEFAGRSNAAYVLMHMLGTPSTMQNNPVYSDVCAEVADFFAVHLKKPGLAGKENIILDPGYGFGKRLEDNFRLLNCQDRFAKFGFPLLTGISRKSMLKKSLGLEADDALNGTTVLNTIALLRGARILRVHDVKEAVEAIKLVTALIQSGVNN